MKSAKQNTPLPPRWAEKLLILFHPENTIEEVQGDLEELYVSWYNENGSTYANLRYILNIISVLPPFVRRRRQQQNYHQPLLLHPAMIQNYFKIALRSLQKNKLYSFINLIGLTLGLGVAITLFWIVRFEYSFDRYHSKADRIYRIAGTDKFGADQSHVHQTIIKTLKTQFPQVEKAANLYGSNTIAIKAGTQIFNQKNIFFTSPDMLEIIDVKWIEGSPEQSLGDPGDVVIDDETAAKMFGGNAMGKRLRYNNTTDLTVSGIIRKVPVNSEFPLQMIISWETLKQLQPEFKNEDSWGGGDSMDQGYVLLKKGTSPATVGQSLSAIALRHKDETNIASYRLQPLSEMHFDTAKDAYNYSMSPWIIYSLASIGIFLVFIACINFINLATVQAIQRSREIAMRKVLGSGKGQLIGQFFGETAILVFTAIILGSFLAVNLISYSSELLNTQAGNSALWQESTIVFLLILGVAVTLLAGFYPALILSRFEPIRALQNRLFMPVSQGISLRSTLVVLQFVIAQVLLICTILGVKQIRYFYQKDLGFEKSGIITVAIPDRSLVNCERLRTQLLQHNEIKDVAFGLTTPASKRNHWWGTIVHPELPGGEETFRIQHIDTNYFDFFHIPILAGRKLTSSDTTVKSGTSENTDVLINEKAAADLGFKDPEKALGQKLEIWGSKTTVIGVVKNYNSEDLKSKLMPHIYFYSAWNFQLASIRIDPKQKAKALEDIGKHWKALYPNHYYDPKFLEDDINTFYDNERKLSNFLQLFAGIGIFIGSLGLFGLVSFVVTQRTKEIGVRKVLGATVPGIVQLLSKDFLKLVLVAFAIATPLAWYAMTRFLESYTYKTEIEWWVFALAGTASMIIAFLTISFQSVKAALMNPVRSLKAE